MRLIVLGYSLTRNLTGFLISKPLESLPRYAPPPPRSDSRSSSRAGTPEPTFKSSPTAL